MDDKPDASLEADGIGKRCPQPAHLIADEPRKNADACRVSDEKCLGVDAGAAKRRLRIEQDLLQQLLLWNRQELDPPQAEAQPPGAKPPSSNLPFGSPLDPELAVPSAQLASSKGNIQ